MAHYFRVTGQWHNNSMLCNSDAQFPDYFVPETCAGQAEFQRINTDKKKCTAISPALHLLINYISVPCTLLNFSITVNLALRDRPYIRF